MPENDSSSNIDKLTFVDDQGRYYVGARVNNLNPEDLGRFHRDLEDYVTERTAFFFSDGVVQFDGGKHGVLIYLIYDPYEHLIKPQVLKRG